MRAGRVNPLRRTGDSFDNRLRALSPRAQRTLAAAAMLGVAVGTELPWSTYPGFPGLMTLSGYPGGSRLYCVVLASFGVCAFVRWSGGKQAGLAAMLGVLAVAVQTAWAISLNGGPASVAVGGWLTIAAAVAGVVSFRACPDRPAAPPWQVPAILHALLLVVVCALGLAGFVLLLDVQPPSQILGLLIALVAGLTVLQFLGVIAAVGDAAARLRALSYLLLAATAGAFPFTQHGSDRWLSVAASTGVFAAAAVGLNVVVGLAGLLDLGYVAFFGVGAYTAGLYGGAVLGPGRGHLPFVLVLALGAAAAGVFGVIIGAPTLRLRGDYLAIVTLGFGEIFNQVVNNTNQTGGPQGLADIPALKVGSFSFGVPHTVLSTTLGAFSGYYYLEIVLVAAVMFVFARLQDSRVGRAWIAIREDELAAAAMGINTTRLKLLAFGMGATLAGAAGTVNAHVGTQVSPDSYTFQESVLLLAAVVLGGMGSVGGAVIGSALLLVLPEKLRAFSDYRVLFFGLALIAFMRFRPEGLLANRRRSRELHATESGERADALSAPPGSAVSV